MTPEKLDDVMRRALQFQMMELPGQWPMMHMGTLYLVNDLARAVSELRADRTPDPAQIRADALREAIWAAFIAGVGQGSDEATAYEWGTAPQQSRQQAFDDFMADWNEDSAYLRALLATPLSPTAVDGSPAPDAGGKEGV